MIRAENLVKKYGEFVAVDGVSFSIPEHQVVGLLGHNGAGKTTILRMLTGALEPTSGMAFVAGHSLSTQRISAQRAIGYLPETCPLYPEMTVVEYLSYMAELRGLPAGESPKSVRRALELADLGERALSPIATLSKGFRQRVGIAQALIHNPKVLILDEPTSGLDPSQIGQIRTLVRNLSETSTVVLSTHILQEVEAICDRAIILSRGKLALDSTLDDLKSSNRLILRVDGDLEGLKRSLLELSGVVAVEHLQREGQANSYGVEIDSEADSVSPALARALVEKGIDLISIRSETKTLEAVFGQIHSESGAK